MSTIPNFYSLRGLRSKSARDAADGYVATLLCNGRPVARLDCGFAPDDDTLLATFDHDHDLEAFIDHVAAQPSPHHGIERINEEYGLPEVEPDEAFLRDLVEHTYHEQRIASFARGATAFRLDTDPPGYWRRARAPYRPALASQLINRFWPARVEFYQGQGGQEDAANGASVGQIAHRA